MFCENCGAKIADTAKFCRYCGAKQLPLTEEAPVPAPKQQQNPSVSKASKTSATQKTEKQALIDHLGALYAAEMGVIRSEQLIQELETQKNAFVNRHRAQFKPQYFVDPLPSRHDYIQEARDQIQSLQKGIDDLQHSGYSFRSKENNIFIDTMVWISMTKDRMEDRDFRKRMQQRHTQELHQLQYDLQHTLPQKQQEEDRRFALAQQAYARNKKAFEQKEIARKQAWELEERTVCQNFEESKQDILQQKNDFLARRQKLYDEKRIYEQFYHPIAEYQLREYLKMGLVDQLEGPQGGYAFYLNELHTKRICGSIEELQAYLGQKLDTLSEQMSTLIHEVRRTNQKLAHLQTTLSACCTAIEDGFARTSNQIQSMSAKLREEIASQARPIREAVQRSEYNLYLASLRKELDQYDYGRLRRPTMDDAH